MKNDKEKIKKEFKRRLYAFILKLIKFIDLLPKNDSVCRIIGNQLLRSGTSIIGNYIEGQAASSRKEFLVFLQHCLKSTNESKAWFCLLQDSGRAKKEKVERFLKELNEYSSVFTSSILTIKGKKIYLKF